ncbi:MAG: hypothetical protein IPL74_14620 [Bacteroidetes bacterium]|nr:hypothetical protein [Bacteroidota bacterium]
MDTSIGGSSPFPGLGSIQFMTDSIGIIAAGQNGTFARTGIVEQPGVFQY